MSWLADWSVASGTSRSLRLIIIYFLSFAISYIAPKLIINNNYPTRKQVEWISLTLSRISSNGISSLLGLGILGLPFDLRGLPEASLCLLPDLLDPTEWSLALDPERELTLEPLSSLVLQYILLSEPTVQADPLVTIRSKKTGIIVHDSRKNYGQRSSLSQEGEGITLFHWCKVLKTLF